MKRTKSMIYAPSTESNELYLTVVNNGTLHERHGRQIINNLIAKAKKGIYNHDRAVDLLYTLVNEGSKQYLKDFGYMFTVQERFTAAVDLEQEYFELYINDYMEV